MTLLGFLPTTAVSARVSALHTRLSRTSARWPRCSSLRASGPQRCRALPAHRRRAGCGCTTRQRQKTCWRWRCRSCHRRRGPGSTRSWVAFGASSRLPLPPGAAQCHLLQCFGRVAGPNRKAWIPVTAHSPPSPAGPQPRGARLPRPVQTAAGQIGAAGLGPQAGAPAWIWPGPLRGPLKSGDSTSPVRSVSVASPRKTGTCKGLGLLLNLSVEEMGGACRALLHINRNDAQRAVGSNTVSRLLGKE